MELSLTIFTTIGKDHHLLVDVDVFEEFYKDLRDGTEPILVLYDLLTNRTIAVRTEFIQGYEADLAGEEVINSNYYEYNEEDDPDGYQ